MKNPYCFSFMVFVVSIFCALARANSSNSVSAVAQILKKYRVQSRQSFYAYHYVSKKHIGMPKDEKMDFQDPRVSKHVQSWSEYFWSPEQAATGGHASGLYAATDPIASRMFGGKNWILYRLSMPQDLVYLHLDETALQERMIPGDVKLLLNNDGCDEVKIDNLILRKDSKECRAVALEVLRALNIDAIQYGWTAAEFENCPNRKQVAVLVLKTDKLVKDSIKIFSVDDLAKEDENEASLIAQLFKLAKTETQMDSSNVTIKTILNDPSLTLWPSLQPASLESTKEWMKLHLLGCE